MGLEGAKLELEVEMKAVREYYKSGKTREESWRRAQLLGLAKLLEEREGEIYMAIKEDLGKHHVEAYRDEIGVLVKGVDVALRSLKHWMSPTRAKLPFIAYPTTAHTVPEPLGLILVISSWNLPFGLSIEPVIGAVAAGNAVVIKPSELSPASSALLAKLIPIYLDPQAVKVVPGDAQVGQQLLDLKWDKILFTGSPKVGQIVMAAAAKHLTPVCLELGGKCPAVFDHLSSSWDKKTAVNRLLAAKFGSCAGQACIAVDYALVEKKHVSELVDLLKAKIKEMFGDNPRELNTVARIVNKHNFSRLRKLMGDPSVKSTIVHGGSFDEHNLFIEPTIMVDPPLESSLMTEEIFGPFLPIITLDKIEDSIEFIKARPRPLAIYAFTNDDKLKKRILSETSSGSVTFNDAIVQYIAETLPFGGVGESGFGRYHGKFTFEMFSHEKAVMSRGFLIDFWFRFPPWNDHKLNLFKVAYRLDVIGIVLTVLGLKKSKIN
uniref:Aldehyde dehydrogenase n=1 Tax=Kalanchoe fedtschenkoi TaxID=63787 RepID=A0A7N0V8W2_KALFE